MSHDGSTARLTLHGSSHNLTTTWAQIGSDAFMSNVKPLMPVVQISNDYTVVIRIQEDGKLYMRSISGSLSNKNIYSQINWAY